MLFDTNINKLKKFNYKVLASVFFVLLNLLNVICVPSIAGEKVSQSLMTEETSKVKIDNQRGSIRINTWDKKEVLVTGVIDDLAENFIFTNKDGLIVIDVVLTAKHANGKNNGKGSELEIWLPKKHDLQFNGIATDISLNGLDGKVDINSVSGSVTAKGVNGKLRVKSISGNIQLNNIYSYIDISTVSGNLNAEVDSSHIKIKAVSSDIYVETSQMENINLFTISGVTKLSGRINPNANIKLENISGESFFFYDSPLDAKVTIETGPDGTIINRIKPFKKTDSHLNTQRQVFVEGSGNALITMHTLSGKVGFKKYKEMNKRR